MKKIAVAALLVIAAAIAGCAGGNDILGKGYRSKDYSFHKNTNYIKVNWNLKIRTNRAVAVGYVEPSSHDVGLHTVKLELVGLDSEGRVISSAKGMPLDEYIMSPSYESPFEIVLPLKGGEKDFTIRGSYYHYPVGNNSDSDEDRPGHIPLK